MQHDLLMLFRTQLFVADEARTRRYKTTGMPEASAIRPLDTEGVEFNGKPYGGLWTSTRLARGYSDWVAWCRAEAPEWLGDRWALQVRPDARVMHVYTRDDAARLPVLCFSDFWNNDAEVIDYAELARDYDGIHFANPWAVSRYSRDIDVESTLWFRWAFDRVWLDMRGVAITRRGKGWHERRYGRRYAEWSDYLTQAHEPRTLVAV